MGIVGLDLGRRNVKIYTGDKYILVPSIVGEWRERKLRTNYGKGSFECTFRGEKYFVGVLAEKESEFARQMLVENKATPDALILALVGLHQTGLTDFDIVTGLPVNIHDSTNKASLMNLLRGVHKIEVNGVSRDIIIPRVRVSVEGGGAFWSNPRNGLVHIIDGGSKTINYITMNDRVYVDRLSGTIPFGFDTNKSVNPQQLANRIAGELGKVWSGNAPVYTVGGQADSLAEYLKPYFYNIEPYVQEDIMCNDEVIDANLFANARGYYNIGATVHA